MLSENEPQHRSQRGPEDESDSEDESESEEEPEVLGQSRTANQSDEIDDEESASDDEDQDGKRVPDHDFMTGIRGSAGPRRGYSMNPNRSPAVVHCPDATKLHIEYIRKGKYHMIWFGGTCKVRGGQNMPFCWSRLPNNKPEVEFDWHIKEHIAQLNRLRNDKSRQITGITIRDSTGGPFNTYEEQWLVEQEAMCIEEKFWTRAGQAFGQPNTTNPQQFQGAQRPFQDRPLSRSH
ncbi:uncharacterized protein A1O5_13116 [Cladophialophora psammophila CBS 110553]|uniref:Uncharacterized protein n=1 Tax=Cladophialophora psammophila CBS 110553 TaxID=1182543 RepID=W9W514_9EURO|nr:uncharacterized protein A1O5_13116 [Cladophialophora psammophila CBS 110553]EXJ53664.1 hypothetical protein A1O5_13116 [Cladophialophora psammophila CBS 110553]